MPTYLAPGIYVEEQASGSRPIAGVSTSVAAFLGVAEKGPTGVATLITSLGEFVRQFGGPIKIIRGDPANEHYLYYAVRHFFTQGGSRCYVVRVVHYTDPDTGATDAVASAATFTGTQIDGTATLTPALTVSALNPGVWGDDLSVRIDHSSRVSVLLAQADIAGGGSADHAFLQPNSDVVVGSLLWIVEEWPGVVESVTNNDVLFQNVLTRPVTDDPSGFEQLGVQIDPNTIAFTPDFQLVTAPTGVTLLTGAETTPPTIELTDVIKADGTPLRHGDVVNFVVAEPVLVTVTATSTSPAGNMRVAFASTVVTDTLEVAHFARAYARDFTLRVFDDDDELETHASLSLIDANAADFVNDRLGAGSGGSTLVVAAKGAATGVLVDRTASPPAAGEIVTVPLAGGDDGTLPPSDASFTGSEVSLVGIHALDRVRDASILCIPGSGSSLIVTSDALAYCGRRQDMIFIVDPPADVATVPAAVAFRNDAAIGSTSYGALYFPWITIEDPFTGADVPVPSSGAIAGVYANTDSRRGVYKAPAGTDTGRLTVANGIGLRLTKADNDTLYQSQVNAIRSLTGEGIVVWGARTLDTPSSEWRYINVRRLFIFLEQSIERGTQWVAFEPNDTNLWKNIRRNVSAFLRLQWIAGMLAGTTEEEAFFVKCDDETNPPEVVEAGQVITEIGVAPLKPAEFVIFRISQLAGGSDSA